VTAMVTGGSATFDPVKTPYALAEAEFPRGGDLREQLEFLLRYVILAPSTHNTQPWKFALTDDGIEVYADYARRMPVADPGGRELIMSIGAAIFTLRVAASHYGIDCRVDYDYSGASDRPVAVVQCAASAGHGPLDQELEPLFAVIPRRHTNRNAFLISRLPQSVVQVFAALPHGSQAALAVSADGVLIERVAELVAEADRRQLSDPEFRKDVAEWMRPNWTERPDGIPGASLGVKGVSSALAPWATRVLDLGRVRAAADRNLCREAPGLIVVQSEDSLPHWLEAGELLDRILLTIVREGLQVSYFNMPIQVPELRLELRRLLGLHSWPQALLRMGYSLIEPLPTPRRPVENVLIQTHVH